MELTLITVNANGLCSVDKRSVLVQWLRSLPTVPDVICQQECHCVSLEECRSWFRSSGFSSVVSSGSVGPVVVLFCFVIPFFWLTRGLILMVVFFNVSSCVVIVFFV